MALNKKQSGSILLFVGAPGTGKTSIGQSIAEAMERPYARVSLGGIRDEAVIRGHRRTYIGAMPGRIMEGIKRCGGSNPVMVLDEVDKLFSDLHGDPSSALLEVLDPEQNSSFTDHYLNVPYDLSDVFFICTANRTDTIPEPLLNRMEVIAFQGYTAVEKFHIARKHLLPKAMAKTGLKARQLKVSDEAIRALIADYTAESGVRGLKKMLETLCRMAAVKLVRGEQKSLTVSPKKLPEYLDCKPQRREPVLEPKAPGVVNGLAWTAAGGETLFVETALTRDEKGGFTVTGQLGDVMKESAQLALTLVRERFPAEAEQLKDHILHLHVPAGAIPKDGPSAGITMTVAMASLLTGKSVDPALAMTGEISLRGRLLPIGGLPEKLLAAQRAGIRTVIIPEDNTEDLDEVAAEVKEKLEIRPMRTVEEVLKLTGIVG
jgi:ATP-dependent Lon protease